ncbi:hypothetical protein E2562_035169 [Oryza meyeriana var. granulata]|uniref:Uncharacterized protein n=1 Tax=Oryza meyeriana var. granulata TaxID=110450 RepID=A0A6G1E6P9_9ORYZ|nr:hypothetical protein E2562_035169 [Oryza meyeriana var. granulata]
MPLELSETIQVIYFEDRIALRDHCCPVQKVVQVPVDGGRRHTLALTETKNVFSWGKGHQ